MREGSQRGKIPRQQWYGVFGSGVVSTTNLLEFVG